MVRQGLLLLSTRLRRLNRSLVSLRSCYRYGQTKEVFVYRFLTRGTAEEKIYARCVTKTGLACRVIDSKSIKRSFTDTELKDLSETLNWVQCDRCNKWRVLYDNDAEEELEGEWYCSLNTDPKNNTCEAEERDQAWYEDELAGKHEAESTDEVLVVDSVREEESGALVEKDTILQHLLETTNANGTKIVNKYKFHESLLASADLVPSVSTMDKVSVAANMAVSSPAKDDQRKAPPSHQARPDVCSPKNEAASKEADSSTEEDAKGLSGSTSQPNSKPSPATSQARKVSPSHVESVSDGHRKPRSDPTRNPSSSKSSSAAKSKAEKITAPCTPDSTKEEGKYNAVTRSGRKVQQTKFWSNESSSPEQNRKRKSGISQNGSKGIGPSSKKSKHNHRPSDSASEGALSPNKCKTTHKVPDNHRAVSAEEVTGKERGQSANDAILVESGDENDEDETVRQIPKLKKRKSGKPAVNALADGVYIV